jgi:hypothetical protein
MSFMPSDIEKPTTDVSSLKARRKIHSSDSHYQTCKPPSYSTSRTRYVLFSRSEGPAADGVCVSYRQVVLVTGGGRGIGEMIAEGYVSNGAKVSFLRHRSQADSDDQLSIPRSTSLPGTSRPARQPPNGSTSKALESATPLPQICQNTKTSSS